MSTIDSETVLSSRSDERFVIDFFQFSFLVEACIPPRPIARAAFWNDVIDRHYHNLTRRERNDLFTWVNRCYSMERGVEEKNVDCLLFNARYDKNNQYELTVVINGIEKITEAFRWEGKYYKTKNSFVNEECIINVKKIEYED